ncbi:radical SAM protein [Litorivita pollutaquae]|uniref:Radical SAM protein n=2 Tax=Litorivita pollutaquae TaxID=2200892 RepID=A0A2V4MYF6_9RHOB|nr:radical SAM protein [Litorivita pollutaquae]PYC49358.1 radical SAM protein [Litorivita pollutaquae]
MKDHAMQTNNRAIHGAANDGKFTDPALTAKGEARATVALAGAKTLWFNTGTLCNITCANCYIDSSPTNDALVYMTAAEVADYLDQAADRNWPLEEVAFTGGEPFMNPQIIEMMREGLSRGYRVLVLTNAMLPMMRKGMRAGLEALQAEFGDLLTLRISLDHWQEAAHDKERGKGAFARSLNGMDWLRDQGIKMAVAGRSAWFESDAEARSGYAQVFAERGYDIETADPAALVLFPEMDMTAEVPEITTQCWGILGKSQSEVMCSSSRMVVKRKGAARPAVLACTLLAYEPEFELGETLAEAERDVALNHPHCAKFCVLGGAACSV